MIEISWAGTDGSVWDLRRGPVKLTTAGIKGFGLPELDDQTREAALLDGQVLTGWRVKSRTVWLPLRFSDEAAVDVEGIQRAWWRSLAIGKQGTLTVTDLNGATRKLSLRLQTDGGMVYRLDPYVLGDAFGLGLVADRPWWSGPTEQWDFSIAGAVTTTFFGNEVGGGATPFYINPSQGADSLTIHNPGDQPIWIEWSATGPLTEFRLGVDGHYVGGPILLGEPDVLTIESDPLRQVALLDGVKVTRQLTEVDFAPLPVGEAVPIEISVVGAGLVTATFTPRYARAF